MAEVFLHPHVEVGMLTGPVHREGRKVWGRVAGLPKGPPLTLSESERPRLEGKRTCSHVLLAQEL